MFINALFLKWRSFPKAEKVGESVPCSWFTGHNTDTVQNWFVILSIHLLQYRYSDFVWKTTVWKCYFVEQICRKRRCRRNQVQIILNYFVLIISLSRNAEYVLSLLVCESFSLYNAQSLYRYFPKRCAALRCRPIFSKWEECLDIINVDMRELCSYFLVRTFEFENLVHA